MKLPKPEFTSTGHPKLPKGWRWLRPGERKREYDIYPLGQLKPDDPPFRKFGWAETGEAGLLVKKGYRYARRKASR